MTPDEAKRKLAEMLASRDDEDEEKKKQEQKIKANAFYIDFNAPQAYYEYARTKVAS